MTAVETRPVPAPVVRTADSPGKVVLPPPLPRFRRAFKHPRLMHYHRLTALVIVVNLGLAWLGGSRGWWEEGSAISLAALSHAALANFTLAILIRQSYVINLLFRLATSAPTRWPLRVRWTLGKVYHFGGLHVGGALAGTLWFLALVGAQTLEAMLGNERVTMPLLATSYGVIVLLLAMVGTAVPPLRARYHDRFERVHRFGGWAALLLLWAQTVLSVTGRGGPDALARAPEVWVLALLTISVALPWVRLRKVEVALERPSSHVALARFDYGVKPFAGSSTAISRSPLREWHSFANVPAPGRSGFRLTVSAAGNWTRSFIDDGPSFVWVKGIPTAGVANIETLFERVVYIATGSGIGPVLPHLLEGQVPSHLVWVTRSPRATYGAALVDEILAVQPSATIWDTSELGKPDMVGMAYAAWASIRAEAVICISNKQLTWQVVHGLESRGIPAYGAIWDS